MVCLRNISVDTLHKGDTEEEEEEEDYDDDDDDDDDYNDNDDNNNNKWYLKKCKKVEWNQLAYYRI